MKAVMSLVMFSIEALHPDGWRCQGHSTLEYWATQEAQIRCCSDGRHYRIMNEATGAIAAMVPSSSCRHLTSRQVISAVTRRS